MLTIPAPGGVLAGSSVTFTWSPGAAPVGYQLWLGTTGVGSSNLYKSGATTVTSETVSGLPTNGVTVFARLYQLINGAWTSADYTYTEAGTMVPAALTTPAPASVLAGSSVTFTWSPGAGPAEYELLLGTTGVGSSNLYNSGATTATSETVSGLPTKGVTVFARFYQLINGAWKSTDYTYTEAGTMVPAALTTPAPGSVLAGSSVTFTWSPGAGPAEYELLLGTTGVGSYNLYNSGATTATSETVSGLPTNGVTVFARLNQLIDGAWKATDYTYTEAGTMVPAALTTPAPGSVLAGSSVTFTWSPGAGPTEYQLWLGSTGVGSYNLYNSGATTATSETVSGLPTKGVTVFARLYQLINGAWKATDYTYTEAGTMVPAALTTPAPGSVLAGSSVTFTWSPGAGPTEYQLWLGSTGVGSYNLYNSGATTATSETVSGLPTKGVTVFARLYQLINGAWKSTDYTYTEAGTMVPAALTTPAPGSVLAGSSVTFTWSPGAGPAEYELWLGTTGVGSYNLYNSGATTATSETVSGLPTKGVTVFARLNQLIDGAWKSTDYTYTEAGTMVPAALTTPAPGSVLAGSSVTFTWSPGAGPAEYELLLGSTGVGSYNLFNSGATTATSETVSGLPTNGVTVFARLNQLIDGAWKATDYTYTEAGTMVPAALTTPAPGSVLAGSSVTFTWSPGAGPAEYQLRLGSTGVGSYNLFNSGATTATSETVSGLPTNGVTVFARLYQLIDGAWKSTDYTYTSGSKTVLSAFSCSSGSMTGSGTNSCTVTLNAAAASGGLSVSLSSNNAAVTVPATVTVPANATSTGFTATVSSVATAQAVTLTAGAGGVTETFALKLNAAVPTLNVMTSISPTTYHGAVTFTATISSGPSGTVTFYDGGASIGTGAISGTTATLTTSSLVAGSHTITANWGGNSNFAAVTSAAITQVVNQAAPAITWAAPSAIVYGTALSATQLDAGSTVAGTFAYTPAAGTVLKAGSQTLSVTFTPTDAADYSTAKATVGLTVNQAAPAVTWAAPSAIVYGTALSATQLNASSTVAGTFAYTPAAGTVLKAGSQTLSVTFTPTDAADYSTAKATVGLTVNQAAPAVTWAAPSAIVYGTALSATQLNASSTVAGTFAYTPAAGTVLKAGSQTLSVTFTPTDATDYSTAKATVGLTVNQAAPAITWAAPSAIVYGTALSATQLDAGSTVAGTFAYTPAAGTVLKAGSQTLSVTFTPTDAADYSTAKATVGLTVNQAAPAVTWAAPSAIVYGTALSATQLDASSTVAGTFAYTPAAGTVLKAGSQTLSVTFTPTDATDYSTAKATVGLTVNQAAPAITWPAPSAIVYGTALSATQLDASSTVAGTFAYTPAAGTVLKAGSQTLSVTFTPTDAADYSTAKATVGLTVNQAAPAVTWAAPSAIVYGTALSATQLDASSTVAGTFAYTPAAGTVLKAGSQTLSVTFTPTDATDYSTAKATVGLTVNQAAPAITWAAPSAIVYGTALSATQLDAGSTVAGTFAYTPAAGTVLKAGSQTLSVTFTPTDAADYSTAKATVGLTVNQAAPAVTWAAPSAIVYGTALSATQLNASSTIPGAFVYSPAAGAILAVGSDTLSVTFTPTDSTDYTTATQTVTLTVNSGTPMLSVNATSVGFGDVALNTLATQTVTLTSSGTASVTVNSATVTGTGFSLAGSTFSATLTPGQTATLGVQFDPTTAVTATGQLTITSNSSVNGTVLIPLTGTGTAAAYSVEPGLGRAQWFCGSDSGLSRLQSTGWQLYVSTLDFVGRYPNDIHG